MRKASRNLQPLKLRKERLALPPEQHHGTCACLQSLPYDFLFLRPFLPVTKHTCGRIYVGEIQCLLLVLLLLSPLTFFYDSSPS